MQRLPNDQFPDGLRVLLVSNDQAILRSIQKVSSQCNYQVNVLFEATVALDHLREKKDCFDLVLFDDYMSDMDGYKFVEHVQLEINLPVIMISGDDRRSSVMKGLRSGASDYLIKPVSEEVLRNIWQHAWKRNIAMNVEGNQDDHVEAEAEARTYVVDATRGELGGVKASAKRSVKEEEEDGELVNNDPPLKKRRVVWSTELHAKFVEAVNKLGVDKAVPKAILESMRRPGLTRENVASHLQKYRLYLKRTNAETEHHSMNGMQISTISGSTESKLGRLETEALAQVHPDLLVHHHQHQHQHQHHPNRHHPDHYYYYNNNNKNNNSLSEHSKNCAHDHSINVTGDDVASCSAMMENHVENKNNMQLNYLQHRLHQQTQQENCSFVSPSNVHHQLQDSAIGHPYCAQYGGDAPNQTAPVRDQGYAIPGAFSALKMESPMNLYVPVGSSNGNTVNEPNVDMIDTPELGIPPDIPGYHPSLDYMPWDNR